MHFIFFQIETIQISIDNYSELEDWHTFVKEHPSGPMPPRPAHLDQPGVDA